MRNHLILPMALLAAALAPAQTTPPVNIRVTIAGVAQNVTDGSNLQFNADAINKPLDAQIAVAYRGTGTINFPRVELTGATDFSASNVPSPDVNVGPNDGFTMGVRFVPSTGNKALGVLRITYTETPTVGRPVTSSLTLNLTGVAPDWAFTYLPPPAANSTPLLPGGAIAFPATNVNDTVSAGVVITNRGSGPGTVGVIRSTGAAFSLASLPSPPVSVDAGKDLRFAVRYAPTAIENSNGSVSIEFVDRTLTFGLTGSSTGAVYSYEVVTDGKPLPFQPNGSVSVPDANVGDKSSIVVRVTNTGNADGRIPTIGIQGAGFSLTDTPFLPATLQPGNAVTMTITFAPTAPGRVTGRVRVGNDVFDVVATGLGANLTYSYLTGAASTSLTNGGTISFTPVAAGQTSTVRFVITNSGTAATTVSSVGIIGTGTTFAVTGPNLPASVAAGQSVNFTLTFAPVATGNLTSTLRVDTQSFTLSGFGNPPPALPALRYSGASGAQQPGQQIAVGLSLAQNYPLAITGTLNLAFNSEVFANDPAVQFAVGGRSVTFTIPAGQRDAVFQNGQTQMRLQTGTVAGAIVITPAFSSDGGIALTPTNVESLTLTVAQSAPRLLNVQVTSKTTTGFTLLVTGYATARQLSTIDLTFTATSGENVPNTKVSLQADPTFTAWYQSTASAAFGSQFTASIPITLSGDLNSVSTLIETLKSVSVTLTSRAGASNALSADIN